MGRTDMEHESATRRNLILASSAQMLALNSSLAFGQSPPAKSSQPANDETLDRVIARTKFTRASDCSLVFRQLWSEKIELSLAIITSDVEAALSEIAKNAQNVLLKAYGPDNAIPQENLRTVLAGTLYMQNIIFAVATDTKSGVVTITRERIQSMKDYYCSNP